jgi:hypothetical protein
VHFFLKKINLFFLFFEKNAGVPSPPAESVVMSQQLKLTRQVIYGKGLMMSASGPSKQTDKDSGQICRY